jgi:hypothetical protein
MLNIADSDGGNADTRVLQAISSIEDRCIILSLFIRHQYDETFNTRFVLKDNASLVEPRG